MTKTHEQIATHPTLALINAAEDNAIKQLRDLNDQKKAALNNDYYERKPKIIEAIKWVRSQPNLLVTFQNQLDALELIIGIRETKWGNERWIYSLMVFELAQPLIDIYSKS